MSAGGGKKRGAAPAHADERWLLTYADMITLLMALFIVMWSISTVNISKFTELKKSLRQAFAGQVLQGSPDVLNGQGHSTMDAEGQVVPNVTPPNAPQASTQASSSAAASDPSAAIVQRFQQLNRRLQTGGGNADLQNLQRIKQQIDQYAAKHGLSGKIQTSIDERGLVIHLLTDQLLFDTGQAELKAPSLPLLGEVSGLLAGSKFKNSIRVEGNTDNVPISTARYRSNWELSTARSTAVLEFLLGDKVGADRLSAIGYADQRPTGSNETPAGRALNRRVDIVVLRTGVSLTSGDLIQQGG